MVLLGCMLSSGMRGEDYRGFYFYNRQEDDLIKAITSTNDKTEKARLYLELSRFYQQRSYKAARKSLLEARNLAHQLNDHLLLADSYLMEAQLHFIGYVGDSAQILLNQALKYADTLDDKRPKAYILTWLAMYYVNTSNRGEFMKNIEVADQLFRNINNKEGRLFIVSTLANQLNSVGLQKEALDILVKASSFFDKQMQPPGEIIIGQQLAEVYRVEGRKDTAVLMLKQLLPKVRALNFRFLEATLLRQLASIAISNKEYDDALDYLNKAYEITSSLKLDRTSADILTMLANLYYETGNSDLSFMLNHKVRELRDKLRFPGVIINTLLNLGMLALEQNKIDTAIYWLDKGFRKAREIGSNRAINIVGTYLSKAYEQKGEYQKAYDVFAQKVDAESKINRIIAANAAIALSSRIEESKMTNILNNRRLQYRLNTFYLYGILLLFFLVIIVLIFSWQHYKIVFREKHSRVREEMLRQQMNPHFIFNALIAIQSFIYQKKSLDAVKFLDNFSTLIRLMLVSTQSDFVSLKDDIDIITNYLRIQKLRFDGKFDFSIECDPQLPIKETAIPPLLTQPFIENCIEHGFNGIEGKGFIWVKYGLSEGVLMISILDNGKGLDQASLNNLNTRHGHKPMGIQITKERIEILNRDIKGTPIKFNIGNNKAPGAIYPGTRVDFSLPLIKFNQP